MEKFVWLLIYSPLNNDLIFKTILFNQSSDLESFVLSNDRKTILVRSVECIKLRLEVCFESNYEI